MRLGYGLMKGQRAAVIGLCVLASLGLLVGGVVLFSRGGGVPGAMILGVILVIYAPPIGVGFANWKQLK